MLLNHYDEGTGPVIVLLHGMASSLRYWDVIASDLRRTNRVIRLDLLGFGRSPMPDEVTYDEATHLKCIKETLDHLEVEEKIILVGHSMGALLALSFALQYPHKVSHMILFGMPVFSSPTEARSAISRGSRMRELAYFGKTSWLLCTSWCKHMRPISRHAAKLYLRRLPSHVAEDSVLHTWKSYIQSLENIVIIQDVSHSLEHLRIRTVLVYGHKEDAVTLRNMQSLPPQRRVRVVHVKGGHNFPLENPLCAAKLIRVK